MTWQRHKGTNTLPPRWTSAHWDIFRAYNGKRLYWSLFDAGQWSGDFDTLRAAQLHALIENNIQSKRAKLTNAATAP